MADRRLQRSLAWTETYSQARLSPVRGPENPNLGERLAHRDRLLVALVAMVDGRPVNDADRLGKPTGPGTQEHDPPALDDGRKPIQQCPWTVGTGRVGMLD